MKTLLVIDVQESFSALPSWKDISDPDIVEKVQKLVDAYRESGNHVVWIIHNSPGSGNTFDPKRGLDKLIAPLEPQGEEPVFVKTSHNAFTTTPLAQYLTKTGSSEIAIAGIRTEQCCETTARVAKDLGYHVDFVLDATATHPIPEYPNLSTEDIKERTAAALTGRFATIVSTQEEIESLESK